MNVLGVEYMALESRDAGPSPRLATYGFDMGAHHVGNERIAVALFRASDCRAGGTSPQPPSWFGVEFAPEDDTDRWGYWCPTPDSDQRPAGFPLHASTLLPYLEPRYGDAWIAFIVELPEAEE